MREFINSIKEWYQRYLYNKSLKIFHNHNTNRLQFYPDMYLDNLNSQIEYLKNYQVKRILNHELTSDYFVVYGKILELVNNFGLSLCNSGYNYVLNVSHVFSKKLCRNLSGYCVNEHIIFNSCIQPDNFIKLIHCIDREFLHSNKKYKTKILRIMYRHSLDLIQEFNEEKGIKLAIKNIKFLATKPKLKSSLPSYKKINMFHYKY